MPKNLLVADDSLVIRKSIAMVLSTEDVQITSVDNGMDAIAKARELLPDLVMADVLMPGKSGYEVSEALKSDPATAHIPVVLLAGTFEAFDEARARAAKVDAHITKPFESGALLERVRGLVGISAGPTDVPRPAMQAPVTAAATAAPRPGALPNPPGAGLPSAARPAAQIPGTARPGIPGAAAPAAPMPGGQRPMAPGASPARPLGSGMTPGMASAAPMPGGPRPGVPSQPSFVGMAPAPAPGTAGMAPGGRPMIPGAAPAPAQMGVGKGPQMTPPQGFRPASGLPPPPTSGLPRPPIGGGAGRRDPFGLSPASAPPPVAPPPASAAWGAPTEELASDVLASAPASAAETLTRSAAVGMAADGGEAKLREALSSASKEVIEKIAWEVVPQLAEAIIRQELERLIQAREGKA